MIENPSPSRESSPGTAPLPGAGTILPVAVATRFLQWGSLGLILPVSNLFRLSKGLSLGELGFSAAIVSAVVILLEVPTGILADRVGRRRVYLASLAFFALSCLTLLVSRGFLSVTAGFALYGVSRALSSGSLEALLIDRYLAREGEARLHRLIAATNAADTAGLALGSLAGGFLPMVWAVLAPEAGRYDGTLIAMLVLNAFLAGIVVFAVSEDNARGGTKEGLRGFLAGSLRAVTGSRELALILATMVAWGFAFSAVETYWQPRLADILGSSESTWAFGLVSTGYFLAALLGSLAAPLVLERTRVSPYVLLFLLRLLTAGFIVLLALQGGAAGFAVFYLAMFCWNGMVNPPEGTVLNLRIPAERRASLLSAASLLVQLGGLAGALAFGFLVGPLKIPGVWFAAAAVFAASAPLYLAARRAENARVGA
jgi:MFS family permease